MHAAGVIACLLAVFFTLGCSRVVIRDPVLFSQEAYDMTLVRLAIGPDQYNTAGMHREPQKDRRFVWATVAIRNKLKREQRFYLDRITLTADGKEAGPLIIDMDSAVTMRANPEPRVAPDEVITRRLVYSVPETAPLEKLRYQDAEIVIRP